MEYFKLMNFTKKEQIHPHVLGDNLHMWIRSPDSITNQACTALFKAGIWSPEDDVRTVSDKEEEDAYYELEFRERGDEARRLLKKAGVDVPRRLM